MSEFKFLLYKLRNSDFSKQDRVVQEIKSKINSLSPQELKLLLEFMNTISDIELEVKLFSFLALCLALNDNYYETIVCYNPMYDKIEAILSRGLPLKCTTLLNFVTTLVFTEDVEGSFSKRKKLAMHAQNMIRVSGCLSAMTTLFVNSMMFPDTWKALCQCLAECSRDCQLNKVYCANLIPLCVQKCLQGLTDVIMLLHAVLNEHCKNIQIFLNCNGITIFNRDLLQYTPCLQLLCAVLQVSKEAAALIVSTSVPKYLGEILHWNGSHSQKGQWCTIAIYYLNACKDQDANRECDISTGKENENIVDKANNTHTNVTNIAENTSKFHINISDAQSIHNDTDVEKVMEKNKDCNDDTRKLFSGVIKEILYWKSKDEANTHLKPSINAFTIQSHPEEIPQPDLRHQFSTLFNKKENFSRIYTMSSANLTNPFLNGKESKQKETQNNKAFSKITSNNIANPFPNTTGFKPKENRALTTGFTTLPTSIKPPFFGNTSNNNMNHFLNNKNLSMKSNKGSGLTNEFSTSHSTEEKTKSCKNIPKQLPRKRETNQIETDDNNELSFTFLQEQETVMTKPRKHILHCKQSSKRPSVSSHNDKDHTCCRDILKNKQTSDKSVQANFASTSTGVASLGYADDDKSSDMSKDFKPTIMSTPKRRKDKLTRQKPNIVKKSHSYTQSKQREHRRTIKKLDKRRTSSSVDKMTNKSMSARFLGAINESCTTFLKTVKDVFMPWKNSSTTNNIESTKSNKVATSNYSFMEYMKKRDAMLGKDSIEDGHSCNIDMVLDDNFSADMMDWNNCKTCNDTAILKQKLSSNEYLCKTVKKLKLGINLFGCDFKKISRTFWPHESYMSPTVLYGLYRKLIAK